MKVKRTLGLCGICCIAFSSPAFSLSNSVEQADTSLVNGESNPSNTNAEVDVSALFSDDFIKISFEDAATNGLSPKCAAFIYTWYGDSRRLYGLLDALVSKGVNVSKLRLGSEYKVFTTDWDSPEFSLLHVAAVRGKTNIVQKLVSKYGLSPDDRGESGEAPTPLELLLRRNPYRFEVEWGSFESFRRAVLQLVELGAHTRWSRELSYAIGTRNASLVEAMLKSGSDPNHMYDGDAFPLILEVNSKDDDILKLMLDYGADVHATNFVGYTILDEVRDRRSRREQFRRLGLLPEDKKSVQRQAVDTISGLKSGDGKTSKPKTKSKGKEPEVGAVQTVDLSGGVKMDLVWCSAGSFMMGSPPSGVNLSDTEIHLVTLTNGFWIAKTEVTWRQWNTVMAEHLSASIDVGLDAPVDMVSWYDCQRFIQKVNAHVSGGGFRLPTEEEWEYAARGGAKSRGFTYSGANELDGVGWYVDNSGSTIHSVAQKAPNELGLYDMSGNILEWCSVSLGDNPFPNETDIVSSRSESICALRGGCYIFSAEYCCPGTRFDEFPDMASGILGFRLVRDL